MHSDMWQSLAIWSRGCLNKAVCFGSSSEEHPNATELVAVVVSTLVYRRLGRKQAVDGID